MLHAPHKPGNHDLGLMSATRGGELIATNPLFRTSFVSLSAAMLQGRPADPLTTWLRGRR
jgi:hypothetical protein